MAEFFIGEVRVFPFNFAPRSWAMCNGQLLPIAQNQALFSLLGTQYGGDGRTTFALPDLRGRLAVNRGSGFVQGQSGGEESHTLLQSEMPQHVHAMTGRSVSANVSAPTNNSLPAVPSASVGAVYATGAPGGTLAPASVSNVGGSQPHSNVQPYLTLNFCIALAGIFPPRN
jgi:microcystin-dependent protein